MLGTVRAYDEDEGCGAVAPDGGGPDAWFHFAQIEMDGFRALAPGDRVEFDDVRRTEEPGFALQVTGGIRKVPVPVNPAG